MAFLSCSCRDGEVGAEPQSSLPGRLILELNPGKETHYMSVHVIYNRHSEHLDSITRNIINCLRDIIFYTFIIQLIMC